MLIARTLITIVQQNRFVEDPDTKLDVPNNKLIQFSDVNSIEIESSWENLTQIATVKLGRKYKQIFVSDIDGEIVTKQQSSNGNIYDIFTIAYTNTISYFTYTPGKGSNTGNTIINLGGFDKNDKDPLFQRGDIIYIQAGYKVPKLNNVTNFDTITFGNLINKGGDINISNDIFYQDTTLPITVTPGVTNDSHFSYIFVDDKLIDPNSYPNGSVLFHGYLTNISADNELIFKCEDFMYYLKQARCKDRQYLMKDYTIESMLGTMIKEIKGITANDGLPTPLFSDTLTIGDGTKDLIVNTTSPPNIFIGTQSLTKFGDITTKNATVGSVLELIKNKFGAMPYFNIHSNQLFCSAHTYNQATASIKTSPHTYTVYMSGILSTVIDNKLQFRRKDDQRKGIIVKSLYKTSVTPEGKTIIDANSSFSETNVSYTKSGKMKTKDAHISIFVGDIGGSIQTLIYTRSDNVIFNKKGEMVGGSEADKSFVESMLQWGNNKLSEINFDGYYGSFTTLIYPYMKQGDVVSLIDPLFAERSGYYYIKKVIQRVNMDSGLTQEIFLDYKIPI